MKHALFITATGTDIGKTYVTALIVKKLRENGLNAGYYKAALSGAELVAGHLIPGDAKYVCDMAGIPGNPAELVSYIYKVAVSPHLAASLDGNQVKLDTIKSDFYQVGKCFDYLCMEGSGGIVCPLRIDGEQTVMLADIIKMLGLDVLIVASAALGTINSTVLTVEYARSKGIGVCGIILNHFDRANFMHLDNKAQLEYLTGIPIIACVKTGDTELNMDAAKLTRLFGGDET